jgi:hypothetical protein
LGLYVNSREECLREAAECDRLAGLASTLPVRNMMKLAAFQWRELAEKAAERQKGVGNDRSELARESPVLARRDVRISAGQDRWAPAQVSRLLAD